MLESSRSEANLPILLGDASAAPGTEKSVRANRSTVPARRSLQMRLKRRLVDPQREVLLELERDVDRSHQSGNAFNAEVSGADVRREPRQPEHREYVRGADELLREASERRK